MDFIKKTTNQELLKVFEELLLAYAGRNGLFDSHRRMIYSYIKMSFVSGRTKTNGDFESQSKDSPWNTLNTHLFKAMTERLEDAGIYKHNLVYTPLSLVSPSEKSMKKYEISRFNKYN
jgi:hypothetical protein